MTQAQTTRTLYLTALAILCAPIVWASFWYNKNAYSVLDSAVQQMGLYFVPMAALAVRAWLPKVNPVPFGLFFFVMIPLVTLSYTERADTGWIYLLLEIPVIWAAAVYSCISISKYLSTKHNA